MQTELHRVIKRDRMIQKFCIYGFLKDLKFFAPWLLIFLISKDISLFQIGILIAIREIIINVFEIPSGFVADIWGKKKELYLCFVFYIISFIIFYLSQSFVSAIPAMIFFGLGEAFRTGSHKAMIYTYLDSKGWQKEKTFVYGRTRSFSLAGMALSSLLGVALILFSPSLNHIFLFSIIPYVLDIGLIATYPAFLDRIDTKKDISVKKYIVTFFHSFKQAALRRLIIIDGMTEAAISYTKDYIQPLLASLFIGSGIVLFHGVSSEDNLNILLGIVYALYNIIGSLSSGNSWRFKGKSSNGTSLYRIHLLFVALFALLYLFSQSAVALCIMYAVLYALHNIRKPVFVDEIDEHMEKCNRVSMLSASSQCKSLWLVILAPLFGWIADESGKSNVLLALTLLFACTIYLTRPVYPIK